MIMGIFFQKITGKKRVVDGTAQRFRLRTGSVGKSRHTVADQANRIAPQIRRGIVGDDAVPHQR